MAGAPSLASADRAAVDRGGFPAFVELASPHVPRITHFVWGRHQSVLAEHFQDLYEGVIEILLCNIPPGHMKSTIMSVLGPAWLWSRDPAYAMLCASHSENLVTDLAELTRDLMLTSWYRERWGDIIVEGGAIKELTTYKHGYRLAGTVRGGSLIGRHGAMFIVDDPLDPKAKDAVMGRDMSNARSWLKEKVLTRAKVGASLKVCLTMQRLHPEDPSGFVLERFADDPKFRHVNLPFTFEPEYASPYDWRTKEGEELWPEAKKARDMQTLARASGGTDSPEYLAHAQQRPIAGRDQIFNPATFLDFNGAPPFPLTFSVLSVDPTFSGRESSDDVALEVWGYYGGHFYCYYSNHEKRGFKDTMQAIRDILAVWPVHNVLIEEAANGAAIVETLKPEIPGVLAIPVAGGPSKRGRARAASIHFMNKCVHFDKGAAWYAEKARLLARFTGAAGGRDDTVDTTSQAILWLALQYGMIAGFDAAMAQVGQEIGAISGNLPGHLLSR